MVFGVHFEKNKSKTNAFYPVTIYHSNGVFLPVSITIVHVTTMKEVFLKQKIGSIYCLNFSDIDFG